MSDEFTVHRLNEAGLEKAERLAIVFGVALAEVDSMIPAGRERALVVTKLQEACFFAKRAIATQPENQARRTCVCEPDCNLSPGHR